MTNPVSLLANELSVGRSAGISLLGERKEIYAVPKNTKSMFSPSKQCYPREVLVVSLLSGFH